MELLNAKKIALDLMQKHELLIKGWTFEFDNRKRGLGCCKHTIKTITFSKHFLMLVDVEEFINTILHEIAHALVGIIYGYGHGHDLVWKMKAVEIGCNGKRLYDGDKKVKAKYVAICPKCGRIHYLHRMRENNKTSCGKCSGGKFNDECLLIYEKVA